MSLTIRLLAASVAFGVSVGAAMAQTYDQQSGYLQPAYGNQQSQEYPSQTVEYQQPQQQDYGYPATQTSYNQPSSGSFISGSWYLKLGGAILHAPKFEGASGRVLSFQPLVSLGKHGNAARFTSRNDNISLALLDDGGLRAGLAGKFIWSRDSST